jgi:ABC transporter substrate binding protein
VRFDALVVPHLAEALALARWLASNRADAEDIVQEACLADPIAVGLVTSLARPGGNITWFSNMAAETAGKSVELFRDMLPSIRRVAALANPADSFTTPYLEQVRLAGRTAGIRIEPVAMARGPEEVEAALARISQEGAEAVVVQGMPVLMVLGREALQGPHRSLGAEPIMASNAVALQFGALSGDHPEDGPPFDQVEL